MYMKNSNLSTYAGTIAMLTVKGRLALADNALAGAEKTHAVKSGEGACAKRR
jgi:hypothetical protein